jgi:hypothetical protein
MSVGVGTQFTANLPSGQTQTWFTWGWDPNYLVIWSARPTTQAAQVRLDAVSLEYGELGITYWLTITNTGSAPATFEARYYFKTIIPEGEWRSLGPANISGCIVQVAIDPNNSDRLYALAQGGGLWRLNSVANYPAETWSPLSDQHASLLGLAVAIAPSDSTIVYLAEGDSLLRSADGGSTWSPAAAPALWLYGTSGWDQSVRRIVIDPTNADRVLIASNTGLWLTTDSGASWTQLLGDDVTDVALDPADPAIVYAAQRDVGVVKSVTGAAPWTTIQPWNSAVMVKIVLGSQGTPATRMVAVKSDQQIMISNSAGGGPWTSSSLPADQEGEAQFSWNTCIAVDPFDNQVILAGVQELFRSTDGGQTWSMVVTYYHPHEDQQSVVFDPANPGVVYLSNDGGVFRSTDGGQTWMSGASWPWADIFAQQNLNFGLITSDLYRVGVGLDPIVGPVAVGPGHHQGLQASRFVKSSEWEEIQGHRWEVANTYAFPNLDGAFFLVQGPDLWRQLYPLTNTPADLVKILPNIGGPGALAMDNRPGSTMLFVGTSSGQLMYTFDPSASQPVWNSVASVSLNEPVASVAFAPGTPGRAYLISSSGKVYRNSSVSSPTDWVDVNSNWQGDPSVQQLAVNAQNDQELCLVTSGQVAVSTDGGVTWTAAANATPANLGMSSFNSILADAVNSNAVYVAGNPGIFVSTDSGQTWSDFGPDLPNANVPGLTWLGLYLYASTWGRGLWRCQPFADYGSDNVQINTQFTATIGAGQGHSWFTWGWPTNWFVVWSVRPLTDGGQVMLDNVDVQLGPPGFTYTLTITNTGSQPAAFEAKYAYVAF